MADDVLARTPRARLHERYLALRQRGATARARAAGIAMTARAGRYVARRCGCDMTFAQLATMPEWEFDEMLDRRRLAAIAGLTAAAPILLHTLDGAKIRRLADQFGDGLVDRVLDACGDQLKTRCEPETLTASALREYGAQLLEDAQERYGEARSVCDLAWRFYGEERQNEQVSS
ncbi:hypothetical protein [Qipengyuania qiaonensis]|uniref:Uncharacterized protein n=1 Tax=Qipengyuania qiaonensis TaxID=2867240 RepID=A0ABS7J653_9SPHN|nr:hypothetical protein [Qipengyuania qiaonensis]MBX7482751.1 hypothetical protein [Qipengyuania qiaonensis]